MPGEHYTVHVCSFVTGHIRIFILHNVCSIILYIDLKSEINLFLSARF